MTTTDDDRFGFSENRLSAALGNLVPQPLARRSVAVRVRTDRRRYGSGEPVEMAIEFRNRLPVPVTIETPKRRLWGWTVDGLPEASDKLRYEPDAPSAFAFGPRERKEIRRTWDGRLERADDPARETLDPGEHEIAAFVATAEERPRDTTTITIS